jgi:ABC-type Mn2+/Zn2+ transport system ATPase subunit
MRESAGARSVLDQEIVLSGGERNRLTLAYYLWVAERRRAQVLVLDECEQGTDVANVGDGGDVYELLLRIRRAY